MDKDKVVHRNIMKRLSRRTSTKIFGLEEKINEMTTTLERNKVDYNLNEIVTKNLSSKDPQFGKNQVYFQHLSGTWKEIDCEDQIINILSLGTNFNHKEDKACDIQQEYHKNKMNIKKQAKKIGAEFKEKEEDSVSSLRNQLTYAERTSQTINPEIITKSVETDKLERNNHSGILHKWDIFDKYIDKYIQEEDERNRQDPLFALNNKKSEKKKVEEPTESITKPSLLKCLKLVERQILQTLNYDPYNFYREWNKQDEGLDAKLLLMLLPFPQNASIRNRSVTSIVWNNKYEDLYAVGYGSYKFPSKSNDRDKTDDKGEEKSDDTLEPGYIFVFSVKNNFYPELKYTTESGVLSLDFHPKEFSYLVAGMYDGTVAVYDIKQKIKTPIITCDIRLQKHMDPVWQTKWYSETDPEEYVFFSISSDGKVYRWSFFKNKNSFEQEEIVILKYTDSQNELASSGVDIDNKEKTEETFVFGNSGGLCFDFNPHKNYKHLFVCGTEEGHIQLCSVKHRGNYIQTYEGHTMGVYTLTWNPYHPKIFASCSGDWTIKIWHYKVFAPLIIFDMQNPVGDVSWTPWCSTIFAAVTVNGDMKFFDLNRNRKSSIYEKKYQDTAINHISFNKYEYVFLTGNDKGKVRMWKMAEPLRQTIDKKEEEAKEEEKKSNQKSNQPETKLNIPRNLVINNKKKKKEIFIQKDNKNKMINETGFIKEERERVCEFLQLLDIKDYE